MTLNEIAGDGIQEVNADVIGTIYRSTGYTTGTDGKRAPTYSAGESIRVQTQGALSAPEVAQVQGLNIQGEIEGIYLRGEWHGTIKADQVGGDKVVYNGKTWMIVHILENWAGWTKVVVARIA